MKKNKLALLITLVLALLAALLIWNDRYLSVQTFKDADFAVSDTANITKIFMANLDSAEVLLERSSQGWTVNKTYRAQQKKIDELLYTLLRLRVRAPVSVASHNNVIARMSSLAVKVEVYQTIPLINLFDRVKLFPREKLTKVYYVGDVPKDNIGTFMLKEGASQAYIMYLTGFKGFVMTRYSPHEDDWRDHVVFRTALSNIKSVEVDFNEEPYMGYRIETVNKHQYRITRLADSYLLPEYDTLRVLNFLSQFRDIRFEALLNNLPQSKKDSILLSPYLHKIKLIDNEGTVYQLTTFTKKKLADHLDLEDKLVPVDLDRMYALINDNQDLVLLQYYVFDKVLRPVIYFEKNGPDM